MNKGFKKRVIQLSKDRPELNFADIARMVGCSYNSVKYHLNPGTKSSVDDRRKKLDADNILKLKLSMGGACSKCGYNKCMQALHFHHEHPSEKSFTIARIRSNYSRCEKEAKKCILLCANCHAELHFGENGGAPE